MTSVGDLQDQASNFAADLTAALCTVVSSEEAECQATTAGDGFIIHKSVDLVDADQRPLLRLELDYECTLDGVGKYLAIQESRIKVFAAPIGRQPVFRYEYVRGQPDSLPAAHIHVHGEHKELQAAMADCGSSTQRAKRRSTGEPAALWKLHFPVGGARFRPTLEDVLCMLIEEFGIEPACGTASQAYRKLNELRARWRRLQVRTVVRDAPSEAVEVLRELGYDVTEPANGTKADDMEKLRRL